jgi:fimbrial isopeptide formation D2 family protein/LPXTG-motif cell wall-anchored protein
MKTYTRKITSLILAAVLVLGSFAMAFAVDLDSDTSKYTIKISNGVEGETYTAYKVFDVTLANPEGNPGTEGFSYTISNTSNWWSLMTAGAALNTTTGAYTNTVYNLIFTPSASDPTVFVVTTTGAGLSAYEFAAALNAHASKPASAGAIASYAAGTADKIVVPDLGYYFIDTSLGSLCSLDTTNQDVEIYEKNTYPSIVKNVKDHEEADTTYAKAVDVDLGDQVDYRFIVNTGTNNTYVTSDSAITTTMTGIDANYLIVDQLPTGVAIEPITAMTNGTNATVTITDADSNTWTLDTDFTAVYDSATNKLTITLLGDLATRPLRKLQQNKDITIVYTARVTSLAEVDDKNPNTVTLTYKEQTSTSAAMVYTWSFNTLKYTGDLTGTYSKLADATFNLKKAGTVLKLVKENATTFRFDARLQAATGAAIANPDGGTVEVVDSITTTTSGAFIIKGLDAAAYQLVETKAPDGYNILTEPVDVTITSVVNNPTLDTATMTKTVAGTTTVETVDYIAVQNQSGLELPSTGGIGTTLFYIIGAALVIGAGVMLVARKKANR